MPKILEKWGNPSNGLLNLRCAQERRDNRLMPQKGSKIGLFSPRSGVSAACLKGWVHCVEDFSFFKSGFIRSPTGC
jgi:hypothetical protein